MQKWFIKKIKTRFHVPSTANIISPQLIPGQQINDQESLSLWGYEDIVMEALYALSLGDLNPDIVGSLELFSSFFIPAEVIRLV